MSARPAWVPSHDALIVAFWVTVASLLLGFAPHICLPFVLAFVLAWLLDPAIAVLEKQIPARHHATARPLAVSILLLAILLIVVGILVPLLISVLARIETVVELLTGTNYTKLAATAFEWLRTQSSSLPYADRTIGLMVENREKVIEMGARFLQTLGQQTGSILNTVVGWVFGGLTGVLSLAVVPILLFYFLLDARRISGAFFRLVPPAYVPWTRGFFTEVDHTLKDFLRAQVLVCAVYGLVITLGLAFLDIPFAWVIGPVAGVANVVPYLGVIVGLAPALVIALITGGFSIRTLMLVVGVAIIYFFLNILDSLYLSPRFTAKAVRLHPLLIIFALYLGGTIGGVYGLILAVPAAACLRVLLEDVYMRAYDRPWA